jgi:polysaccharide biosynthesis protein PslH
MKTLLILQSIPFPANSGAPLRNYNLLRRVAAEHDVWLLSFAGSPEQADALSHLRQLCAMVETVPVVPSRAVDRPSEFFQYLLKGLPPDLRFYQCSDLGRKVASAAATVQFDVVEISESAMALYLEALPPELRTRTILTFHDVLFRRYNRLYRREPGLARKLRLWLYSRTMRRWEPRYAARFARCVAVSEADRRLLKAANPRLRVRVVPNGVDARLYQPLPRGVGNPTLLFVGNMDARTNVDAMQFFCRDILPRIQRSIPCLEMWIVGINPRPEVTQLGGHGVHVTGLVEDVRPYYARSLVCVVPLRAGSGTRLKILEAMALGRPVVSTSIGCEGLAVRAGEHLFIADTPEAFAESTIRLLTDPALATRIAAKARELVASQYDWDVISKRLLRVYEEVAAGLD